MAATSKDTYFAPRQDGTTPATIARQNGRAALAAHIVAAEAARHRQGRLHNEGGVPRDSIVTLVFKLEEINRDLQCRPWGGLD